MEPIELPVACTLDAAGQSEQAQRWARLLGDRGTARTATPDGVELRFRHTLDAMNELEALVAVERDCCAWARWEIHHATDGDLVLRAAAAGATGAAALQAMFSPA